MHLSTQCRLVDGLVVSVDNVVTMIFGANVVITGFVDSVLTLVE